MILLDDIAPHVDRILAPCEYFALFSQHLFSYGLLTCFVLCAAMPSGCFAAPFKWVFPPSVQSSCFNGAETLRKYLSVYPVSALRCVKFSAEEGVHGCVADSRRSGETTSNVDSLLDQGLCSAWTTRPTPSELVLSSPGLDLSRPSLHR